MGLLVFIGWIPHKLWLVTMIGHRVSGRLGKNASDVPSAGAKIILYTRRGAVQEKDSPVCWVGWPCQKQEDIGGCCGKE